MLNLSLSGHLPLCLVVLLLIAASRLAPAQQSLRPSLSSPGNQERQQYAATGYDYNLKLGPTFLSLGTSLGLEYNDNINLASSEATGGSKPLSDFIYRPRVSLRAIWPITKLNVLSFDLGIGVDRYLNHPNYDQTNITISPNTQLSYDVYIDNVRLTFHDRISIEQNAATRADTSNTGPYSELNNTLGVSALWDLNKTILQAGYDYGLIRYSTSDNSGQQQNFDRQNSSSHIFNGSISFPYTSAINAGLQANYIATVYEDSTRPNLNTTSAGPFLQLKISRYTNFQASAGYQKSTYHFSSASSDGVSQQEIASTSGDPSFYYSFSVQNQLNPRFQHSLAISRERELGFTTNLFETQTFHYGFTWQVNSRLALNGFAEYQRANQTTFLTEENLNYYRYGVSFGYQLTRHLSTNFHYGSTYRTSNILLNEYSQNLIGIDFSYDF